MTDWRITREQRTADRNVALLDKLNIPILWVVLIPLGMLWLAITKRGR